MADKNWRTNTDIQLAKHVALQQKASAAIIIWFKANGQFGVVSYGRDGKVCKATGKLADAIYQSISDGMDGIDELLDSLRLTPSPGR